jgi:uncharacterized protein YegL
MSTANSSGRRPIDELNAGIEVFVKTLQDDPTALTRVQVAVVVVGGPRNDASVFLDWTDAADLEPFELSADGGTPLGEGMDIALQMVSDLKDELRRNGISYTRPWIFVISDGEPTSSPSVWSNAVSACARARSANHALIFSVAVEGADVNRLEQISGAPPRQLSGLNFKEFFVWLTGSLSAASRSRPGDRIKLPPTDPWANVGV